MSETLTSTHYLMSVEYWDLDCIIFEFMFYTSGLPSDWWTCQPIRSVRSLNISLLSGNTKTHINILLSFLLNNNNQLIRCSALKIFQTG